MANFNTEIQIGTPENAEAISALAIQVFLDTYATEGVGISGTVYLIFWKEISKQSPELSKEI